MGRNYHSISVEWRITGVILHEAKALDGKAIYIALRTKLEGTCYS